METKRITAVVLCLIMVFVLLPNAAFAYRSTGVVVGGTPVEADIYYIADGEGGIKTGGSESNYIVYYEASTSTLTLNGAHITKKYSEVNFGITTAICAYCALTINLVGSNTLNGADGTQSFGMFGIATINIKGNGSLNAAGTSCGVYAGSVTIEGGTVNATGGETSGTSCGVFGGSVTIEGGSLTATGGEVESGTSLGVYGGNIIIANGTVNATGGAVVNGTSYGVRGNSVALSDGTLVAIGGKVTTGYSYGVRGSLTVNEGVTRSSIAISGGTVSATGGKVTSGTSYGVCGSTKVIIPSGIADNVGSTGVSILGGSVTAMGGEARGIESSSVGVYGSLVTSTGTDAPVSYNSNHNSVVIRDSTVTATGGESTSLSSGINGNNRVMIENSTVTANGGSASGGGTASGTSFGVYGNRVEIKSGTVKANSGEASNGYSYGLRGYNVVTIAGGTVSAKSGAAKKVSYGISSSNDSDTGNVAITGGTVEAIGGDATDGLSNGVFGNIVGITGGTVLAKGNSSAIRKSSETTLSIFDGYTTPHTVTVSKSISGLPAEYPTDDLEINKYLRVAPGEVTISDVTVSGKQNHTIAEANAIIALSTKTFNAMNEGADVSGWFTNMPNGLTATIKTAVATGTKIATVTFSGRPEETSTDVMEITIPSDKLTEAVDSTVTLNENARWNITEPAPSYDYTTTQVTLYNDPYAPNATIWLAGAGLAPDDRLITERNPQGAAYSLLLSVAGENEVFATYNISLKSGSKSTGNSMSLTFDLAAKYAGQAFTLVHQKADGTYEYFYAVADANGDLTFGPLFELSPFMLVKGTLAQTAFVSLSDAPKTGDNAQTALWIALASTMAAALLLSLALRKRRN